VQLGQHLKKERMMFVDGHFPHRFSSGHGASRAGDEELAMEGISQGLTAVSEKSG